MKAFPYQGSIVDKEFGMDLRDYFASKALQGMLASPNCDTEVNVVVISRHAYLIANAMMKERERKDEQV
jgi:hypothetical protein